MKRKVLSIFLLLLVYANCASQETYYIKNILSEVETGEGTIVITNYGEVEEVEKVLVPYNIEIGTYNVLISRKGRDLYRIEGTNIYIETHLCLELALLSDALVVIDTQYGLIKGSITFYY